MNIEIRREYPDLSNTDGKYEDSSATFFMGDTFTPSDDEYSYWAQGPDVIKNIDGSLTWPSVITSLQKYNINCVLFGAGVGISTNCGTLASELGVPRDDWFLIEKIEKLKNEIHHNS